MLYLKVEQKKKLIKVKFAATSAVSTVCKDLLSRQAGGRLNVTYFQFISKISLDRIKNVKFRKNIKDACKNSDLIIIHTEWNDYKQLNFKKLVKKKSFKVYDLRNIYSQSKMLNNGIDYFSIGR